MSQLHSRLDKETRKLSPCPRMKHFSSCDSKGCTPEPDNSRAKPGQLPGRSEDELEEAKTGQRILNTRLRAGNCNNVRVS